MRIIERKDLDAEQRAAADRAHQRNMEDDTWEPMPCGESMCFWAAIWATPAVVVVIAVWHWFF